MSAAGGTSSTTKTHTLKKHTHKSTTKPANDMSNMQGNNASGDTKAH
jgi:hypothetical protein